MESISCLWNARIKMVDINVKIKISSIVKTTCSSGRKLQVGAATMESRMEVSQRTAVLSVTLWDEHWEGH